jgi:hypothetical protein
VEVNDQLHAPSSLLLEKGFRYVLYRRPDSFGVVEKIYICVCVCVCESAVNRKLVVHHSACHYTE